MISRAIKFFPYFGQQRLLRVFIGWCVVSIITVLIANFWIDILIESPFFYALLIANFLTIVYLLIGKGFTSYVHSYFSHNKINKLIINYTPLQKKQYIGFIWEYFLLHRTEHLYYHDTLTNLYQLIFFKKFEGLNAFYELTKQDFPYLFDEIAKPYYQDGLLSYFLIENKKELFDFYFSKNNYQFYKIDEKNIYSNLFRVHPEMMFLFTDRLHTFPLSLVNFIFSKIDLKYLSPHLPHNENIEGIIKELASLQERELIAVQTPVAKTCKKFPAVCKI